MNSIVREARKVQYTFRCQIRSGEMKPSESMVDLKDSGRLSLYDILLLAPKIGTRKASRICRQLEYKIQVHEYTLEFRKLGDLTIRQRAIIFRHLHKLGL